MNKIIGFVAYPSNPYQLVNCIKDSITLANSTGGCLYTGWEENDIAGRPLTAPIFGQIRESNLLIADITRLNFNVTYEVGYAIGIGRRVFLVRSKEINTDDDKITKIGIYDTLGYETYENSKGLANLLTSIDDTTPINTTSKLNHNAPVYIIETPVRGTATTRIVARVKKARLQFRSFSPSEEPRLSAMDAITHVASSYGLLIPLLSQTMADAEIHNIRAAFIAGLSHGMDKNTLMLQDRGGPVPLDVRDIVKTYSHLNDINDHIHSFSLDVYGSIQEAVNIDLPIGNLLSNITIGDPMAENEFQTLANYYLQTDEFISALRGEVNLVVGRKGTGKTALFSQVRNKKRANKRNIVVDLKPEGYQLIKLKEQVLDLLSAGAKEHLITAFWEYLLYLETCYKVLEKDKKLHVRDHTLYEDYLALEEIYTASPNVTEGDFSERLQALSENIVQDYAERYGADEETRLTADQVTSLIHSQDIRVLRKCLSDYLKHKDDVWILFDNLDRGWSSYGLSKGDVTILKCLMDASRKIQREMIQDGHQFHTIVFIRNDVYQLLMDESPDFGKESRASLDWSDEELLREMLKKRLGQNDFPEEADFNTIWNRVCVSHFKGEETSQYLIDRSLMRPRNLLKLFKACRGFAVNLQHEQIEPEDLEKGARAYSNDLIVDADQELTDIEPEAKNLIYQFIGEGSCFSEDELKLMLEVNNISENKISLVIEFLLYYGFFGIKYLDKEVEYIFRVGYNMQILNTRIKKNPDAITYVLNPAFWPGLGISD